jgi:hypothetical protein
MLFWEEGTSMGSRTEKRILSLRLKSMPVRGHGASPDAKWFSLQ